MRTIAYLANQFPSAVEPYVVDEIQGLRQRGLRVIPCTVHGGNASQDQALKAFAEEAVSIRTFRFGLVLRAAAVCVWKFWFLKDFFWRALVGGEEPVGQRLRAVLHTGLGVYYALLIEDSGVEHIHVHHGYVGSWIAMVAARVLGITYSMTLHGSDLLVHAAFLDTKLEQCKFCVTVSEFNRQHIRKTYPEIQADKIVVLRLGVDVGDGVFWEKPSRKTPHLNMLAVGRLHAVKDHAFLIRACRVLKDRGLAFACVIAGEGPERGPIESATRDLRLRDEISLVGQVSRAQLEPYYEAADLVVLTSRSEGIPLVLMEAMARGKAVLAPAITGIPELVRDGETGFLYRAGSQDDFVARVEMIHRSRLALGPLCRAARQVVVQHFDRGRNLEAFCDFFINNIAPNSDHTVEVTSYAHSFL